MRSLRQYERSDVSAEARRTEAEAIQSHAPLWIASSLTLFAMTFPIHSDNNN
ncbi:hypothetical protein S58_19030 [Bradyrhizobium oligotrophicum S58]|uniref:Uncharacterized protein n=1 Tax=Bradyrhizobium oligotrophicum S58 TaxID=1245469 RepID=M4ZNV8_9BRAD|nr:hypothetical protein S58_19030 [Bradyrhizobium oligotrophicum S58]